MVGTSALTRFLFDLLESSARFFRPSENSTARAESLLYRSFGTKDLHRLAPVPFAERLPLRGTPRTLLAYQKALLQCVSARTFTPFANLYLAYVVSAMTSLDRRVRRDSLALLGLLLERFPAAVADRADRLAPNYAALLALDPSSKEQTGRAEALKSLVSLLRAVSGHPSIAGQASGGRGGVPAGDYDDFPGTARLRWKRGSRRNSALVLLPFVSQGSEMDGRGSEATGRSSTEALAAVLPQMLEKVGEVWVEAAAAVPPDLGLMQSVTDVLLEIIACPAWGFRDGSDVCGGGKRGRDAKSSDSWGGDSSGASGGAAKGKGQSEATGTTVPVWFAQFVPLVLEVFPVRPLDGEMLGDEEAERSRAVEELNMGLCELVVAASACRETPPTDGVCAKGSGEVEDDKADWLMPVVEYVHEVLRSAARDGGADAQVTGILRVMDAALCKGGRADSDRWVAQRWVTVVCSPDSILWESVMSGLELVFLLSRPSTLAIELFPQEKLDFTVE